LKVIVKANFTGNCYLLKLKGRYEGIIVIFGRNVLSPLAVPVNIVASMTFSSRFSITNLKLTKIVGPPRIGKNYVEYYNAVILYSPRNPQV